MRLWTLHPKHLDAQGLVALWREALLAQKVLQGKTKGYCHHPQLQRFKNAVEPVSAIASYLWEVNQEAARRGYNFNPDKIAASRIAHRLPATNGQLFYEWEHLKGKLQRRSPEKHQEIVELPGPECHPLFTLSEGDVATWEIRKPQGAIML